MAEPDFTIMVQRSVMLNMAADLHYLSRPATKLPSNVETALAGVFGNDEVWRFIDETFTEDELEECVQ